MCMQRQARTKTYMYTEQAMNLWRIIKRVGEVVHVNKKMDAANSIKAVNIHKCIAAVMF